MNDSSDFKTAVSRLESGNLAPVTAATEVEWYDLWLTEDVSGHQHLTTALVGGALADRLAWVFHAGYQGMMRYAFPFCPKTDWASYLVAEDKTGEYPGTVLKRSASGMILSGCKSWVAASEHVRHLVVRATGPQEDMIIMVERDEPGVSLSSRDKAGFLGDMSQGFAAFEDVAIDDDRVFTSRHLPANFDQSEPHHVLTALNSFMVSQTLKLGGNAAIVSAAMQALQQAGDLLDRNAVGDDFFLGIADLDESTTETARLFETFIESRDTGLSERWSKDRGVVNMFSRGLQKRAKWLRER